MGSVTINIKFKGISSEEDFEAIMPKVNQKIVEETPELIFLDDYGLNSYRVTKKGSTGKIIADIGISYHF